MFGIQDFIIFAVFTLCFLCAVFCVVYGLVNWNNGLEKESAEVEEELKWEVAENKVNEIL